MAMTTAEARSSLARLIERVNLDCTKVEIVSKHGSAVLLSKDEYEALVETSYLLRSPKNERRLMAALESVREIESVEHRSRPGRWLWKRLTAVSGEPVSPAPQRSPSRRQRTCAPLDIGRGVSSPSHSWLAPQKGAPLPRS
jgi:antitoxin YefM